MIKKGKLLTNFELFEKINLKGWVYVLQYYGRIKYYDRKIMNIKCKKCLFKNCYNTQAEKIIQKNLTLIKFAFREVHFWMLLHKSETKY